MNEKSLTNELALAVSLRLLISLNKNVKPLVMLEYYDFNRIEQRIKLISRSVFIIMFYLEENVIFRSY